MTRGHIRLALPAVALLMSVACTSNQREAPAEETAAPGTQTAAATPGTEASVTPEAPATVEPAAPAPPDSTPVDAPRLSSRPAEARAAARKPAPEPPAPPRAPAAPVPTDDQRDAAAAERAARDASATARDVAREAPRPAPTRMVSIPANTTLPLALQTDIASDTSKVEDRVAARVTSDVIVDDEVVIPEGSRVAGRVTYAEPSGKVKGRAGLTVRFYSLTVGSKTYDIAAEPVRRVAEGTKAKDARNIGIGAGAGAVIGGLLGGRKGAGIGAAVGGAGGTGVVMATRGEEVRMPAGTAVTTRLSDPLVVDLAPGRR